RPACSFSRTSAASRWSRRSEEHTSELQSLTNLVCRLLLEKKKKRTRNTKRASPDTGVRTYGRKTTRVQNSTMHGTTLLVTHHLRLAATASRRESDST